MSLYFETIQLLDGELKNLEFHQERFERTRSKALGLKRHPLLSEVIQVPRGLEQGVLKCRVIYEKEIVRIEYEPHQAQKVHSLKMVYSDSIEYGFKYVDRSELEILFHQRGYCDDILIEKSAQACSNLCFLVSRRNNNTNRDFTTSCYAPSLTCATEANKITR